MICNKCGGSKFATSDSRPRLRANGVDFDLKNVIYRRKNCVDCGHVTTTYEIQQEDLVAVISDATKQRVKQLAAVAFDFLDRQEALDDKTN